MAQRVPLGGWRALGARSRLFATPGSLEMETYHLIDILRVRVRHDEIRAVTLHRVVRPAPALVHGGIALVLLSVAAACASLGAGPVATLAFVALALPSTIACALHVLVKMDVVTVTGKRSTVRAEFLLRKRRARDVFDEIAARAQAVRPSEPPPPLPEATAPAPISEI